MLKSEAVKTLKSVIAQAAISEIKFKKLMVERHNIDVPVTHLEQRLDDIFEMCKALDDIHFTGCEKALGFEEFLNIRLEIEDKEVNGG